MPLHVEVLRQPEFTAVTLTGPASLDDFVTLIAMMAEQTRAAGDKRILVDLLGVEGELKFTDHFQLGSQAAQHLRHLDRLASVVPGDKITRTSEKVAVKQGLQLRVFTSRDEAVRWLTESLQRPAAALDGEQA